MGKYIPYRDEVVRQLKAAKKKKQKEREIHDIRKKNLQNNRTLPIWPL